MSGLDKDTLRHALETARANGIRVVKLRIGDERFRAVFAEFEHDEFEIESGSDADSASDSTVETDKNLVAPVVGHFRPGKKLVEPGTRFAEGEPIGEIVSLGLANEVLAPLEGEIVEVRVQSGDAVEYGQILATMRSK